MTEIILKNPITNAIQSSIAKSINKLNFAVPFISNFAISIFSSENTKKIIDKKIITRFDDSYINSFELPTLKSLLDLGFQIKYDNNIHLKLYITDDEAYVTSSNLTKGGFEDNLELTVKIDNNNTANCELIFNDIWNNCTENNITYEIINENLGKYEVLKKRTIYEIKAHKIITTRQIPVLGLDIQQIITSIFNQNEDYSKILRLEFEANKLREETKNKLKKGYKTEIFYVQEGHRMRKETLSYDILHGYEGKLAGTGLREAHVQSAFTHSSFERVVNYIYPEMIGMKPWNFKDPDIVKEFCNGIFDFDIPSFTEVIPIRLASYFYPEIFLPIFKLDHLKIICEYFGFESDAETDGDRLFAYNSFLANEMKTLPYNNTIKGHISYQVRYTIELLKRLNNGEIYDSILTDYKKVWINKFIKEGRNLLIKLNKIK
jgi:PLD-like domain